MASVVKKNVVYLYHVCLCPKLCDFQWFVSFSLLCINIEQKQSARYQQHLSPMLITGQWIIAQYQRPTSVAFFKCLMAWNDYLLLSLISYYFYIVLQHWWDYKSNIYIFNRHQNAAVCLIFLSLPFLIGKPHATHHHSMNQRYMFFSLFFALKIVFCQDDACWISEHKS